MAAMRTGLLQLQGFLQQEPAVAGDEEDRRDEEVEGDILCECVDGDEDEVEGGIFDYQSDSDRSSEDAVIETQAPPSTDDASTQAAACLQDAVTQATAPCLHDATTQAEPQDQGADGDGDGGEPAAGCFDGLRSLFRRVFTPRRRTTPRTK